MKTRWVVLDLVGTEKDIRLIEDVRKAIASGIDVVLGFLEEERSDDG